jgi:16S rRNA processing protein RimM
MRFDRNSHFLKLESIDSLAKADALAGQDIYVPEEALGPPEEGSFYDFQIIGSMLLTKDGEAIGRVTGVVPMGDRSLLVADRDGKEILIPFTKPVVIEVDPSKKEIRVDLPAGLLELNEI